MGLFDDIGGVFLFKSAESKLTETFEGMVPVKVIRKMANEYIQGSISLLNYLPFVAALGLNKHVNELRRLQNGLLKIIKKEYQKRYKNTELDDQCVLDIMIRTNKESEKETGKQKFTMEEILSIFELFQFAASDTSYQFSSSTICLLALDENKKYQQRLAEEVQEAFGANPDYSSDELNSLKMLDLVFKETGRVNNPLSILTERLVTKNNFDLCGVKLNKGDRIEQILINYQPEYYKDPYKFNPDRHDVDSAEHNKVPHLRRTTFSHGRRACIGKYLGEMMVKLVVGEFLKELEVSVESGYKMRFGLDPI